MSRLSGLGNYIKTQILKNKGKFVAVGVGAGFSCLVYSAAICVSSNFKQQISIPTKVLETEKLKAYLYLGKNRLLHPHQENPNKGSLSPEARQAIREIFPAPLAKFILLIDRKGVDLAEDYVSPWSVLRDAYSQNKNIRLRTVEKIAAYKDWNENKHRKDRIGWKASFKFDDDDEDNLKSINLDAEFRTLAQALDPITLVGLARTFDVDLRLFLPPPSLPPLKNEQELEDMLRELLVKLPQEDVDQCVRYFTSGALSLSEEQQLKRGGLWCFGGNGLNYTRDIMPQEKVELFCLQALVKHSKFEEHCAMMVKLGALQLLQRIGKARTDLEIQLNIVRTIGNICRFPRFHEQVHRSGWVTLLAEFSKSGNAPMRMQASRALANLDRETMKDVFEDGAYLVYPRYRSRLKPEADVVFIHGLMGGAFYSWRQQEGVSGSEEERTDCWPEDWIPRDLPGCRVMCVEYDTELTEWKAMCPHEPETRTISFRSRTILDKMQRAGLGDRPIVWVAHSMGGLIVKHMLMDAMQNSKKYGTILKKTKGVVFYSTPHFGSQLANYSRKVRRLLFPSVEVMELSHDSPTLGVLNDNLRDLAERAKVRVLSFGEMQTTNIGLGPHIKIHIVPPESADPGVGEFVLADTNHLNICKPSSRHSSLYQQTVNFIRSCVKPPLPSDQSSPKPNPKAYTEEDRAPTHSNPFVW
uniref:Protein SERAC1 n=1 Tax=Phallusia mammillata TaxID=59560 RepID=A0A6F9DSI6_9ASCI|nr:protein SERAC1-like [Phallusia mammillata]